MLFISISLFIFIFIRVTYIYIFIHPSILCSLCMRMYVFYVCIYVWMDGSIILFMYLFIPLSFSLSLYTQSLYLSFYTLSLYLSLYTLSLSLSLHSISLSLSLYTQSLYLYLFIHLSIQHGILCPFIPLPNTVMIQERLPPAGTNVILFPKTVKAFATSVMCGRVFRGLYIITWI